MYGSQNVQNVSNGCKVEHKGTAIKGVPGLFGSSYRHGLSDDDSHIFVLLEDKLLEERKQKIEAQKARELLWEQQCQALYDISSSFGFWVLICVTFFVATVIKINYQ